MKCLKLNHTVDSESSLSNDGDAGECFHILLDYCPGSVALLRAYFDESERTNGLLCVAGYVFGPQQARQLTRDFREAFGMYGGFHMTDLVAKKKGFRNITDADRNRLIRAAVDSVKSRFRYGVAVTIDIGEYDSEAPKWIRGFKRPYPFLCHLAMTAVAQITKRHGDAGPIQYVFEAGHAHESEARFAVHQMSQTPELRESYLYGGDAFLPKADAIPLQAADLLAWEAAKFKHETVDGDREIRRSLVALLELDPRRYYISCPGGEKLVRALRKYHDLGLEQVQEHMEWQRQMSGQKDSKDSALDFKEC